MSSVSVFIPCYKYAHYLRGCVESVLRQDGVDVRVLILDDCSPDDTPEVARQLMADDPRVEYHRNATNRGHVETYNVGLEWACGDYCLLLSADDMVTPGALGRAGRVMDEHPEVSLTYGGEIRTADVRFDSVPTPGKWGWRVLTGKEFWGTSCRRGTNIVPTPTAVVRTSVHKKVGGYNKDLPHSGDLEMWLRLAAHGSVGVIDVPQGFYRVHGQNMSTGYLGLRDIRQRKVAFDSAARIALAAGMSEAPALIREVDRLLAEQAFWAGSQLFEEGDLARSREYLDAALELCPELRRWGCWRRLRLKQLLGPGVWGAFRPLRDWVRGKRQTVQSVA
jgi:GT2 family glycosyltransferase